MIIDRSYYQQWTFPPVHFLYFNLAQSLAVFYGRNRWDYYWTEGFPLLLTTLLPFGLWGVYVSLARTKGAYTTTRFILAVTTVVVAIFLSLISHKEVRFIYPLLPIIHVLAARTFARYLKWAWTDTFKVDSKHQRWIVRRLSCVLLIVTSIAISALATNLHQPAPLTVLAYLRQEYITHHPNQPTPRTGTSTVLDDRVRKSQDAMTVSFLMPCHSTPWRSHLIFPGIKAWALSCEPPLSVPLLDRGSYLDEADQFYQDPMTWMNSSLGPPPQSRDDVLMPLPAMGSPAPWDGQDGPKMWTEYIVFFEQLEGTVRGLLGNGHGEDRIQGQDSRGAAYEECWRGWNSWGHDDWRRKGDIVVWCWRQS